MNKMAVKITLDKMHEAPRTVGDALAECTYEMNRKRVARGNGENHCQYHPICEMIASTPSVKETMERKYCFSGKCNDCEGYKTGGKK
jgi:hypothetical protein